MTIPFANNVAYPYPMRQLRGIVKIENLGKKTCIHKYEQCGFHEETDCDTGVRGSFRHYKCQACDRIVIVDGRIDDANIEKTLRKKR